MPAFAVLGLFYRRGWHPTGAVIAAMMIVLGGSAAARLQHTGMIFSYSFFLPALLFLEIALERRSFGFGLLFSVSAALMALGRDQVAFLCAWPSSWAVISEALDQPKPLDWFTRRLAAARRDGRASSCCSRFPALLTMQFLAIRTGRLSPTAWLP